MYNTPRQIIKGIKAALDYLTDRQPAGLSDQGSSFFHLLSDYFINLKGDESGEQAGQYVQPPLYGEVGRPEYVCHSRDKGGQKPQKDAHHDTGQEPLVGERAEAKSRVINGAGAHHETEVDHQHRLESGRLRLGQEQRVQQNALGGYGRRTEVVIAKETGNGYGQPDKDYPLEEEPVGQCFLGVTGGGSPQGINLRD